VVNKNKYKNLVRKFQGNRPLNRDLGVGGGGDNIKMDLRVMGSSRDCVTLSAPVVYFIFLSTDEQYKIHTTTTTLPIYAAASPLI
jgi:hypothetical protein